MERLQMNPWWGHFPTACTALPALIALISLLALTGCNPKAPQPVPHTPSYEPITVEVPARPAGQKDVIELTAPALDTVRVGFIGLGMRGLPAVERWTHLPETRIVALCDLQPQNVERARKIVQYAEREEPATYTGDETAWKQLCERPDIDLVYIAADWRHQAEMGVYALQQGKHVAIEMPAALTLDDIWALVNTAEQTRRHCLPLESSVYDFFELTTLNLAQQGFFGEVLHVEGAYIHHLEDFWPYHWNQWRLDCNRRLRGDLCASHGLGPACQLLNIHRGDRLTTLVAMDTKAVTGPELVKQFQNEEAPDFQNGDHTMTFLRTLEGKTIHIQHNVLNPRPYSRMYQLTGTKGFANKYPIEQYCFRPEQLQQADLSDPESLNSHAPISDSVKEALMNQYKPRILRELEEKAREIGGQSGMDFLMDYRLVYCLRHGLPLDMDVYDLAEWCCLAELTRLSIENGSAPVAVPDFTRGVWDKVIGYRHALAR